MGKQKWNPVGTFPKKANVYKVRQTVDAPLGEVGGESASVEGFAFYSAMTRRWAALRPSVKEALEARDTSAPRYRAGQDKEWCRV
jgi:hypothetical protein